jgi:hypothetical protein
MMNIKNNHRFHGDQLDLKIEKIYLKHKIIMETIQHFEVDEVIIMIEQMLVPYPEVQIEEEEVSNLINS